MDCEAGVWATRVVTVAPSLGSSFCEIPWPRFSGIAEVVRIDCCGSILKVDCRLPTWFIEADPFDLVLSTVVV